MALWSRKKRERPLEAPEGLDVVLDTPMVEASVPPQAEALFDAADYDTPAEGEAEGRLAVEPDAGSGTDAGPSVETEPRPEPDPLPDDVQDADPEDLWDRNPAHPGPEADAPDVVSAEPAREADPDPGDGSTGDRRSSGTHARRRAHGRSAWRRASRAPSAPGARDSLEGAGPPAEPGAEPASSGHRGRLAGARAAIPGLSQRMASVGLIIIVLLASVASLPLLADGINWLARWNKLRSAAPVVSTAAAEQDNLLVIGVSDGVVVGFAALKAERATSKVLGIAIPDGAFVEVPGQGFERVGASYLGGPQVSEDAISNFFGVPFRRHVVVDGAAYQELLRNQDVSSLMRSVTETDLTEDERASLTSYFAAVATKDVWIVPLPVKPVAVGDQRYFEPQKKEIADLLFQWWGVQAIQAQAAPRVIVYNGVGTPGLAGVAAQQLIRDGFKIVDSGNAPNFDYAVTEIHLFHGTQADADAVRASLGVGRIIVESAPQELTDMIVIVGADYRPPTTDTSTVPTEGVQ